MAVDCPRIGFSRRMPASNSFLLVASLIFQVVNGAVLRGGQRLVAQGSESGSVSVDVYYVTNLLDRFKNFAIRHQALSDHRHDIDIERLQQALELSGKEGDQRLLEEAAMQSEESRLESQNAFNQVLNFVNTIKQAMGSRGSTPSCKDLTCGKHAACTETDTAGAVCNCEAGFEGDGFSCSPAKHPIAQSLLATSVQKGETRQLADLNIAVFRQEHVAVVFRDLTRGDKGYLMFGRIGKVGVDWNAPILFSNGTKAYGPVLAALSNGRMGIAYRDQNRGGLGYLQGVQTNTRANLTFLGTSTPFARNQAHSMSIVALPDSRLAVLYADRAVDANGKATSMHGGAALFQMQEGGVPTVLGKLRFAQGPVTRITTTRLSPTSFVVAYRGTGEDGKKAEASVIWAEMRGSELVFDPHPIVLEPGVSDIWARDVSLIDQDTFSYSYHCGSEQSTKQAVVKVDPKTHRMSIVDGPVEIAKGPTPYVHSVSLPYAPREPHSFVYFQEPGKGTAKANVCAIGAGKLRDCKDLKWAGYELSSVAAQPLGDGRLLFVFSDMSGAPYYQFVGLYDRD